MKSEAAEKLAGAIETLVHYAVIAPQYSPHRLGAIEALEDALIEAFPESQPKAEAALALFVNDQHRWSPRPCATCQAISDILGKPWGCNAYRLTGS